MAKPDTFTPQDKNQFPAIMGASGTAQSGTAQARPITFTEIGAKRLLDVAADSTETTGFNGGTVAVGTAAVELTFTGVTQSVMITSDFENGTIVYIGPATVAQDGANAITYLQPDQSVTIDINDASAPLFAVGGTTGQKVYKVALT